MHKRLCSFIAICATCLGIVVIPAPATAQVISTPASIGTWVPAPSVAKPSPFKSLFRDFARVPSSDTARLLSIGAVVAVLGHQVDRPLSRGLSGSASADSVLRAGGTVGAAHVQMAAAVATYAVGQFTNPRTAAIGADLIRAQILTQALTQGVKTSVGRTRPDGTRFSFPSGHTSTSFATATVLQRHLGWKAGVPAYALASYVAASRIQDRRHFLSDVAFGAALGIVAGRTVTIGQGSHRLAVAPTVVPRGGGVSFTWAD